MARLTQSKALGREARRAGDGAGGDGVYQNLGRQFQRQGLGEALHAGLGQLLTQRSVLGKQDHDVDAAMASGQSPKRW